MSEKKDKKKKAPYTNLDEAKAHRNSLQGKILGARSTLSSLLKKNDLSPEKDHSKHKKIGAEYTEIQENVTKLLAQKASVDAYIKENTPAKEEKERAPRETKYVYPAGLDSKGKRDFRIKARKEAAAAAKGEKKNKVDEKLKNLKGKKEEASTEKVSSKKDKKDKKNKKNKKKSSED